MRLKDHIRKVLREEKRLNPMIRRRILHGDLEREFSESLQAARNMFSYAETRDEIMTQSRFTDIVISIMIDGIHYEIHSTMPEDSQWYDNVYDSLKDYYKDRIDDYYDHLIGKTLNEEYEIPLNVRRRLPFLKQVLHNALISSYPCDDYDLNEFTHGIIWSVNEYFHWDNKEKEMTSEEAELTIRAYFLDDISEYYKEQTQNC